jgi:hypothetical protein
MKRYFILLFVLVQLFSYGQAKIGMSTVLSFTPSSVTTPSSSATYSTPINFTAYIKNFGNATFTGSVAVQAKRDTIAGLFLDSVTIAGNLQPNDSISVILSFIPSAGPTAFKSGGNGNTIVVWPIIITGTGLQGDSVKPTIWINGTNNIPEFENTSLKLYPNPVIQNLIIKTKDNVVYKNIVIYDVFGRKVTELAFNETINVSELKAGTYWMIIHSENKSYRTNFIKE